VAVQLLLFFPIAGVLLFLPSGTVNYWEGWMFLARIMREPLREPAFCLVCTALAAL
jgi:hypothetical protein